MCSFVHYLRSWHFNNVYRTAITAIPLPSLINIIRYQAPLNNTAYNSVLLRLSLLLRLFSSESLLRGEVGIHGNCARSSGVLSGDAGMFAISMPSSADATSIDERRERLSGLNRLLRFETDGSGEEDVSGDAGVASGSVGGKML
jgi:hypothetical protein